MKLYIKIYLCTVFFGLAFTGCATNHYSPPPKVTHPDCYCHVYPDNGEAVIKCLEEKPEGGFKVRTLWGTTCSK